MFSIESNGIRVLLSAAIFAAITTVGANTSLASAYPDKPIKVIVPFGAGGTTDIFTRLVSKELQKELDQPIAVINVPGGGSVIGNRQVKDATADGYTVLHVNVGMHTAAALGKADFNYRDFETVACAGALQTLIFVHKDSRWNSLNELLEEAKAKPNTIIFGSNLGAAAHFAGLGLSQAYEGAKFRFVQIGGGAKVLTSMLARESDVAILDTSSLLPFKESGDFRLLALLGSKRSPDFPNLQTAVEQNVNTSFDINYCWYMPKGSPMEAVTTFRNALETVFASDTLKEILSDISISPIYFNKEESAELNDTYLTTFTDIAKKFDMRR